MEKECTENIFYLDLKHVRKYGCAKFQPNPLFSSQQTATESAAKVRRKKKKKKKVGKPIGDPVGGRDAPIRKRQLTQTVTKMLITLPMQCSTWLWLV